MRNKKNIILTILAAIIIAVAGYAYYIWNKPARDVAKEKGIQITSVAIFDSFNTNENSADSQFLNKAIEVTGTVSDVKKNQAGNTVVYLKSDDPIYGVNCTFKQDPGIITKGSTITFKGICTGYLSDVVINEGIMIK